MKKQNEFHTLTLLFEPHAYNYTIQSMCDRARDRERKRNHFKMHTTCFFFAASFCFQYQKYYLCVPSRSHIQPFQGHSITSVDDDDVVCI